MFWDGFQWLARENITASADPNILNQTKKMRRIQISNIPMNMGLSEKDIINVVTKFLVENYLNDESNLNPVVECKIQPPGNTALIELSSLEEANKMSKVDCKYRI